MKIKLILIICLCFYTSFYTKASSREWKSGYIITITNDTIYGDIAYRDGKDDWKNCIFRKSPIDSAEIYTPTQVKELFYNDGVRFEAVYIDLLPIKETVYAECLLKGEMSLYFLRKNNNDKEFESYYAINNTTKTIRSFSEIKEYTDYYTNNKIRTRLKAIFNFNPEISKEISNKSLNRNNIIEIFRKYNDLTYNDQTCVVYQEKKKKKKKYLSINTGLLATIIKEEEETSYKSYLSPKIGAKLYYNPSKISEKTFICIGLHGYKYYVEDEDEKYSINMISYSFGTEYRSINKRLKPCFEIGASMATYHSFLNTKKSEAPIFILWGVYAGIGINVPFKKNEIPIRLSYTENLCAGSMRSLELSIGYKFKLGK